ncbi:MAG: lipopolysaccharide heptosyltransferase II [Nitrospirae bacterium]|nr:lipopolysaccharide heptosyltransferase II [Nitrospirota bacterium]
MFDRDIKKILIRGTNWIGDAVLTMPAVNAVRKRFIDAEISILVKPWVAGLFVNSPDIDRIIIYGDENYISLCGKRKLASDLKKYKFDMAILFQNAFEAAFLAFLAKIPIRYGYNTDGRGMFLTHKIPLSDETLKKHQVWYYLDLLRPIGINIERPELNLKIGNKDKSSALNILKINRIKKDDLIIGINPGASYGPAKRWLPDKYAKLAEMLIERHNARIILFGSKDDKEVAAEIVSISTAKPLNLAGITSLTETAALIEQCRLFITNDSGLMHIAAALNVPVIAIFGSTSPEKTGPYGKGHHIIYKNAECSPCLKRKCPTDFRCMGLISVDEVYSRAEKMINSNPPSPPLVKGGKDRLKKLTPAVFLDRDGTICHDVGYLSDINKLRMIPKASKAISLINKNNMKAVVITNQSGIARGYLTEERLKRINDAINVRLSKSRAFIDAVYYCPHHPEVGNDEYKKACDCRKPEIGMLKMAAKELSIDMKGSYMIGDKITDIQMADKAKIKGILVLTGYGKKEYDIIKKNGLDHPAYVAKDLHDAVRWILKDKEKKCKK